MFGSTGSEAARLLINDLADPDRCQFWPGGVGTVVGGLAGGILSLLGDPVGLLT